ncbi:MAG: polysaccharide deacetylase family protein [Candidatus Omnitrophica bacterium]|nr:polysaccharide deacetylase family protein [Candidatus Omnitrophota bacterium]
MKSLISTAKNYLSKLNFILGNKPKLLFYPKNIIRRFIPSPYKAALIISCDFELIWAKRFSRQIGCDLQKAQKIAGEERSNVPLILELCARFDIPLTWATIGHLFLEDCSKENNIAHKNMPRIAYFENKYWQFKTGDWFDSDPCCDFNNAPEWYAPDLVKMIVNSKIKHEIACHTFSHVDCSEKNCLKEVLRGEISEYKKAALKWGIDSKSFIFPGNLIGNLKVLKEEGFTSYRPDRRILGFPQKDKYGLWQIPTTAMIGPSSYRWDINYCLEKYKTIIERAIKYKRLCHFWFHPSTEKEFLETVLKNLFETINNARKELHITTMGAYTKYLENAEF